MSPFLKSIIDAVRLLSQASPKQMICIKDVNSVHVYASGYLLQLMDAAEVDVIGKKVWLPLYGDQVEVEKMILAEDQKIISAREPALLLKVNKFSTGLKPYFCFKSPLINLENNSVEGLIIYGFEAGLTAFKKHFVKSTANKSSLTNTAIHLTKREKQVIYFFMSHLGSQEIADVLHEMEGKKVSKSTIDTVFNKQLYPKFKVYSRSELYEKLQNAGYENLIPKEILQSGSFFLPVLQVY
ncbi:MAG: hypothetical protein Q8L78_02440 [Coxiellaceae bacterium]|nr:hypothetical protein [Coxiellaceae bacterium]